MEKNGIPSLPTSASNCPRVTLHPLQSCPWIRKRSGALWCQPCARLCGNFSGRGQCTHSSCVRLPWLLGSQLRWSLSQGLRKGVGPGVWSRSWTRPCCTVITPDWWLQKVLASDSIRKLKYIYFDVTQVCESFLVLASMNHTCPPGHCFLHLDSWRFRVLFVVSCYCFYVSFKSWK